MVSPAPNAIVPSHSTDPPATTAVTVPGEKMFAAAVPLRYKVNVRVTASLFTTEMCLTIAAVDPETVYNVATELGS